MSRLRQTIATRLVEAQNNAAILTTFNEVDMSVVMNMRKAVPGRICIDPWNQARFHVVFREGQH